MVQLLLFPDMYDGMINSGINWLAPEIDIRDWWMIEFQQVSCYESRYWNAFAIPHTYLKKGEGS